jgi:hypothetical protein
MDRYEDSEPELAEGSDDGEEEEPEGASESDEDEDEEEEPAKDEGMFLLDALSTLCLSLSLALFAMLSRPIMMPCPIYRQFPSFLLSDPSPGPPVAKKQKTAPIVDDDEGVEVAETDKDDEPVEEEGEEEAAADTAKKSGPAAAAVKEKGGVVPKESDLSEIEAAEEEE